jgi:transcriptional regulator with XRE-family HTH domain
MKRYMMSNLLADKLYSLMFDFGVSEKQLSEQVNIERTTINKILNGKTHSPKIETLIKLSNFFQVELKDLLEINLSSIQNLQHELNVADNLRKLMDINNYNSICELSKKIGISKSIISKLLANKVKKPHYNTLLKIAKFFEIDINQLISGVINDNIDTNTNNIVNLPVIDLLDVELFLTNKQYNVIKQISVLLNNNLNKKCFVIYFDSYHFAPYFLKNSYAVINSEMNLINNSFIIAKYNNIISIFYYSSSNDSICLRKIDNDTYIYPSEEDFNNFFMGSIVQILIN